MKTQRIPISITRWLKLVVLSVLVLLPLPGLTQDTPTLDEQLMTSADLLSLPGALDSSGRDRSAGRHFYHRPGCRLEICIESRVSGEERHLKHSHCPERANHEQSRQGGILTHGKWDSPNRPGPWKGPPMRERAVSRCQPILRGVSLSFSRPRHRI